MTREDANLPWLADLDWQTPAAVHNIKTLEEEASKIGLKIDYAQTKAKVISFSDVEDHLEARNNEIELVDDFKYLGSSNLWSNRGLPTSCNVEP